MSSNQALERSGTDAIEVAAVQRWSLARRLISLTSGETVMHTHEERVESIDKFLAVMNTHVRATGDLRLAIFRGQRIGPQKWPVSLKVGKRPFGAAAISAKSDSMGAEGALFKYFRVKCASLMTTWAFQRTDGEIGWQQLLVAQHHV